MARYVLAPALSYYNNASSGGTDATGFGIAPVPTNVGQRQARALAAAALGGQQPGTMQLGSPVASGGVGPTALRYQKFDDASYAAIIAANPNAFAGCTVSSSIKSEVPDTVTPARWNPGIHKQVVVMLGDSITVSRIGATTFPGNANFWNQMWAFGVCGQFYTPSPNTWGGYDSTGSSNPALGGTDPKCPYILMPGLQGEDLPTIATRRIIGGKSRLIHQFGKSGWAFHRNLATLTATNGGPNPGAHLVSGQNDWPDMFKGLLFAPSQQVVVNIFLGTNDFNQSLGTISPSSRTVQTTPLWGTPAGGTPNLVANLIAMIATVKAAIPQALIQVVTPIARSNFEGASTALLNFINGEFSNYADYVIANQVALGIASVVDTRLIPALDCRNWQAVAVAGTDPNASAYIDGTHMTPFSQVTYLAPAIWRGIDALYPK